MITVQQILGLFILSIPIACVSWTVTHEEIFKEPRNFCVQKSQNCKSLLKRKFFYLFTCEYCFSHYVTLLFLLLTNYKLMMNDWRGIIIAEFSLVWIANNYMNLYSYLRQDIKKEKIEIKELENNLLEK